MSCFLKQRGCHNIYPRLIFELGAGVAGLALGLSDELLQGQRVVFPESKAHRLQKEQRQLNVLLGEGLHQPFEDVKDQERVHHLEVIQVGHYCHQVVHLLALSG